MTQRQTTGERARRLREDLGLTRDDAARRLGVSLRTLARWENNEHDAPADLTKQVAGLASRVERPSFAEFTTLELAQEVERRLSLAKD